LSSTRFSKSKSWVPSGLAAVSSLVFLLASAQAHAFAGLVSPPRFELKAKPGEVLRQILEIGNDAVVADEFAVSTADWHLNAQGGVEFHDTLDQGSCRPWVRIERRTVNMQPKSVRKFRFELHVPPDAAPQECRFAIIIERASSNVPQVESGGIQIPLQGRIGVIVYAAVGDVAPKLELRSVGLKEFNGRLTPAATFFNSGTSHGRPEGVLEGRDAAGSSLEFVVSSLPILPGETRSVALWAQEGPDRKAPVIAYPLRLRGTIEWDGGKQSIDSTLAPSVAVKAGSS
jgi:hypothetical protein